jgi:TolB protein
MVNLEDGKRRRLTDMKYMQHDPVWTAHEKKVVFVSGAGGQNHDLFILDLESGATKQLTAGQRYHFEPACSVNDEIVFSSNRSDDYEIWVCDLEGKRFEQVTHSPGFDGQPTWSPDGRQIAFVSTRSGYPSIWVINRDGSNPHQISPEGMQCRGPAWNR